MKKKLLISSGVIGLMVSGFMLVPSLALAQGGNSNINGNGGGYGYQQSMTTKAEALDMSSDQLRTELESKTLLEVATEKGVSIDQLHTTMQTAAQERWEANGLDQTEIDARLKNMEERQADCDGTGTGTGTGSGGGNGNGGGQHYRANQ